MYSRPLFEGIEVTHNTFLLHLSIPAGTSKIKQEDESFALNGRRNMIAGEGSDAYLCGEVAELLPPKATGIIGLMTDPPTRLPWRYPDTPYKPPNS